MKTGLMSKKSKIIIIVALSSLVLLGLGSSKIVLRNADEPFIDLTGSIGNSIGNAEEASATPGAEPTGGSPNEVHVAPAMGDDYRVVVSGKTVTVYNVNNGAERMIRSYREFDIGTFERDVIDGFMRDKNVMLIDDYADYKIYTIVVEVLDKHFNGTYIPERVY